MNIINAIMEYKKIIILLIFAGVGVALAKGKPNTSFINSSEILGFIVKKEKK